MDNEIDTPTGGEGLSIEQAAAAYVKATASEPVTDQGDEEVTTESDDTTDDELQASDEDAGEEDDGENADEDQAEDGEDAEPESDHGRFVADNAKVRLPDGTVTTVAELKSGSLKNADYTQKTQALAEQRREFEAQSQRIKASEQQLQQQAEYVSGLLRSIMPEPPDPAMVDPSSPKFDIVGYNHQRAQYEQWGQHLAYLEQQKQLAEQASTAEREAAQSKRIEAEWQALLEKAPELKDEKRLTAFADSIKKAGAAYGFTPEELRATALDHRQALVLRDAIAWRKLQESKATLPKKVEGRPPVQKGGKRLNPQESRARAANDAFTRLRTEQSVDAAVAALLASQKG